MVSSSFQSARGTEGVSSRGPLEGLDPQRSGCTATLSFPTVNPSSQLPGTLPALSPLILELIST